MNNLFEENYLEQIKSSSNVFNEADEKSHIIKIRNSLADAGVAANDLYSYFKDMEKDIKPKTKDLALLYNKFGRIKKFIKSISKLQKDLMAL